MFTSYEDLERWVAQPTESLREGLTTAVEWRYAYERQAEERDAVGDRWPVSRELGRLFDQWFATTWPTWALADGVDSAQLATELEKLGEQLDATLRYLDMVHATARDAGLAFNRHVYLYYKDTDTFTFDDRSGRFVPWTVALFRKRFAQHGYHVEEVARAGETANRTARTFETTQPGFIANVIAGYHQTPPRSIDIPDRTADDLVRLYASAFADPEDSRDRLKVIVGVNAHDSMLAPAPKAELIAEVQRAGTEIEQLNVNAAVLGFVWRPAWYDYLLDEWPSAETMRTQYGYVAHEPGAAEAVAGYFPFAEMRNAIKNHAVADIFAGQLTEAKLRPFMHFGDGDAVTLDAPTQVVPLAPDLKPLRGVGLLDRFTEAWGQLSTEDRAHLVRFSGGYAYRAADAGGDLDPQAPETTTTVLANELDMVVRQILGEAAYFAEPNTFVDFAVVRPYDLRQVSLTPPEPDLGPLLGRLVRQQRLGSRFDARLSLVTSGRNAKVYTNAGGFTALADLVRQKSSSAGYQAWAYRVEEYFGLPAGTAILVVAGLTNDRPLFASLWGTDFQAVRKQRRALEGVSDEVQQQVATLAKRTAKAFRDMYFAL